MDDLELQARGDKEEKRANELAYSNLIYEVW